MKTKNQAHENQDYYAKIFRILANSINEVAEEGERWFNHCYFQGKGQEEISQKEVLAIGALARKYFQAVGYLLVNHTFIEKMKNQYKYDYFVIFKTLKDTYKEVFDIFLHLSSETALPAQKQQFVKFTTIINKLGTEQFLTVPERFVFNLIKGSMISEKEANSFFLYDNYTILALHICTHTTDIFCKPDQLTGSINGLAANDFAKQLLIINYQRVLDYLDADFEFTCLSIPEVKVLTALHEIQVAIEKFHDQPYSSTYKINKVPELQAAKHALDEIETLTGLSLFYLLAKAYVNKYRKVDGFELKNAAQRASYFFGNTLTDTWQEFAPTIRGKAHDILKEEEKLIMDFDSRLRFLKQARSLDVFAAHHDNISFGRTRAIQTIDELIISVEKAKAAHETKPTKRLSLRKSQS